MSQTLKPNWINANSTNIGWNKTDSTFFLALLAHNTCGQHEIIDFNEQSVQLWIEIKYVSKL